MGEVKTEWEKQRKSKVNMKGTPWNWGKHIANKPNRWAYLPFCLFLYQILHPQNIVKLLTQAFSFGYGWSKLPWKYTSAVYSTAFIFSKESKLSSPLHWGKESPAEVFPWKEPRSLRRQQRGGRWGLGSRVDKPVLPLWPHKFPV